MGKVIRVLHVLGRLDHGGAETMIMNLYRNIDRSKIQFDFVIHTDEKCDYTDEIIRLGGNIYYIQRYNGKNHFTYRKSWKSFFIKHPQYKIIHAHMRSTAGIYLKIARKYGLKTIAHSHSTSSGSGFSSLVKIIYQYPIRYNSDFLFACSMSAGTWLFGAKASSRDNFFIINNAIDINKFIYDESVRVKKRQDFGIEGNFVIGHVGRFHPSKNHELLIKIFEKLNNKKKNSILFLVGDGELRENIEKKVSDIGLKEKVIFAGNKSNINELLQCIDVFVFPSLYEGLGISVVEAQASGLYCVVSNTIPQEAFVSKSVKVVSLESSIEMWVDSILKNSNGYKRESNEKQLSKLGYDIKDSTEWISNFYLKLAKD